MCFPPFTPFLLLVSSTGGVAEMTQIFPLGLLLVSSLVMLFVAARSLNIAPRNNRIFSRNFGRPLPLV
jgi:hypothetical protein